MAFYRCKMCGGNLEVQDESSVCICDSCGTRQTLPSVKDENIQGLFNRANVLRMKSEFDKAMDLYEKILQVDPKEAEAYWGMILCKYGVEYVEDPKTFRRVPTCHRTSYDAITADEDFRNAVFYADPSRQQIYREEAQAIDEIQKKILAISRQESPYDVFICYKETDNSGKRTVDSTIANEIYYQLIQEGFKVFFAAITLEDKLGTEYEPYIFSALNTARVMLVIGTRPEYFNAVWVKNEWSRYLKTMKQDRSKLLIPCYRDMDAYELPEEFAHLQAQDMSKIGFINDIVRGIKKIVVREEAIPAKAAESVAPAAQSFSSNIVALLKRGNMALEDGEWQKADGFYEEVLNQDAECAEAYLGKLLATKHCSYAKEYFDSVVMDTVTASSETFYACEEETAHVDAAVANYTVYAYLAEDTIRNHYTFDRSYTSHTPCRTRQKEAQLKKMNAERLLMRARQYATGTLKEVLEQSVENVSASLEERIQQARKQDQESICRVTAAYHDHLAQADTKILELHKKATLDREAEYLHHLDSMKAANTILAYDRVKAGLLAMNGYKDTAELAVKCQQESGHLAAEQQARRLQLQEEEARQKKVAADKKRKKTLLALAAAVLCAVICFVAVNFVIPSVRYDKAVKHYEAGEYVQALDIFIDIEEHKDTLDMQKKVLTALKADYKQRADEALAAGDNIQAAVLYTRAGESGRAKRAFDFSARLVADDFTSVAVLADGTLQIQQNDENYQEKTLKNFSSISSFSSYDLDVVGIDRNGVISGDMYRAETMKAFQSWKDVVQFDTSDYYQGKNVALLKNGTVKVYDFATDEFVPVNWKNIVEIGRYVDDAWGLDSDGTIHYLHLEESEDANKFDLQNFTSIEKFKIYDGYALGLKDTNELVYVKNQTTNYGTVHPFPLTRMNDVTDFTTAYGWLITVHEDGTVSGKNTDALDPDPWYDYHTYYSAVEAELSKWRGIVSVLDCYFGVVGITYDGSIVYQSLSSNSGETRADETIELIDHPNLKAQLETWEDIVYLDSDDYHPTDSAEGYYYHVLGLHSDGAVCSLGTGKYTYSKKNAYGNYDTFTRGGGTYDDVSTWKLWE